MKKPRKLNDNQPVPAPGSPKKIVQPVIVSASQNEQEVSIRAYTPGIFEDGGSCNMTATQGTRKVTKTNEAFANVSTTDCAPFIMNRSEFPSAGEWNVVISYSSASAAGESQGKTLSLK